MLSQSGEVKVGAEVKGRARESGVGSHVGQKKKLRKHRIWLCVAAIVTYGSGPMVSDVHGQPPAVPRDVQAGQIPQAPSLHPSPLDRLAPVLADVVSGTGGSVGRYVAQFYAARDYHAAWLDDEGRRSAHALLRRAAAAHEEGLCPHVYGARELVSRLDGWDRPLDVMTYDQLEDAAELDVTLTRTFLRLMVHVARGPDATQDSTSSPRSLDLLGWLEDARTHGGGDVLDLVAPRHPEYAALRQALEQYRAIAGNGGWPQVPGDLFLRPGATADPHVLDTLRRRLVLTGDLDRVALDRLERPDTAPAAARPAVEPLSGGRPARGGLSSDVVASEAADALVDGEVSDGDQPEVPSYDDALVEAVRRFQQRHGLQVDGIIGPHTVAALNVPVEDRMAQIALNMDRWRRLPDDLGHRHLRVNIPDFTLAVVEDGDDVLTMRTIVGQIDRQTPVFSHRIQYLEFRPYWNVPDSIVERDILPRIREDHTYLERHRYEVLEDWHGPPADIDLEGFDWEAETFGYRLRQQPGPHNSLGLVKFMFPNRHAVYLHDTPSPELFNRRVRAFSSGCVRVEDPVALARILLQEEDTPWTEQRIRASMRHGPRAQVARISDPVPVHLLYMTAWVGDDGRVEFRPDVYGRDARAAARLACAHEAS